MNLESDFVLGGTELSHTKTRRHEGKSVPGINF